MNKPWVSIREPRYSRLRVGSLPMSPAGQGFAFANQNIPEEDMDLGVTLPQPMGRPQTCSSPMVVNAAPIKTTASNYSKTQNKFTHL